MRFNTKKSRPIWSFFLSFCSRPFVRLSDDRSFIILVKKKRRRLHALGAWAFNINIKRDGIVNQSAYLFGYDWMDAYARSYTQLRTAQHSKVLKMIMVYFYCVLFLWWWIFITFMHEWNGLIAFYPLNVFEVVRTQHTHPFVCLVLSLGKTMLTSVWCMRHAYGTCNTHSKSHVTTTWPNTLKRAKEIKRSFKITNTYKWMDAVVAFLLLSAT